MFLYLRVCLFVYDLAFQLKAGDVTFFKQKKKWCCDAQRGNAPLGRTKLEEEKLWREPDDTQNPQKWKNGDDEEVTGRVGSQHKNRQQMVADLQNWARTVEMSLSWMKRMAASPCESILSAEKSSHAEQQKLLGLHLKIKVPFYFFM